MRRAYPTELRGDTEIKTIYVDITELSIYGQKTGIQRVVRNICRQLDQLGTTSYEIRYVIAIAGKYFELDVAFVAKVIASKSDVTSGSVGANASGIAAIGKKLLSSIPFVYRYAQRRYAAYRLNKFIKDQFGGALKARVSFDKDSTVLLMDSFWNGSSVLEAVRRAKKQGATIVCMIYDIIAITHSRLYIPALSQAFTWHCDRMVIYSDNILTISNFSKSEILQAYPFLLAQNVQVIRLGADFSESTKCQEPSRNSKQFLTVGTVEIRKRHEIILKAFELLWGRGVDVHWTIIGKRGWRTEQLIENIEKSPELGRRLHWLQNADDEELRSNYLTCNSTIIASEVEGYGLPIIEALMLKSGVIASDIPVFREVGGDQAIYFDLNDPEALALKIEMLSKDINTVPRPDIQPSSWREAAQDVLDAL
ncbi:hypothetical protein A9Q96_00280 [Rhodobacterales bacterium 52_120_T64]|nr:hypothetical protein A9Q96_00280 [Rhodobacterales bacterium 52_120_T64]